MTTINGFRDFYPDQMIKQKWLFNKWNNICQLYGFQQYEPSIIEPLSLYKKNNDDINKQMFIFKDGEQLVSLRPEITQSLLKMANNYIKPNVSPLKWYSISQCWRNEKVSKGRKRDFFQWNVDIIDANNVKYDIELINILVNFFKSLNLTENDITINISSKYLILKYLNDNNINDNNVINNIFNIVDKYYKKPLNIIKQLLSIYLTNVDEFINLLQSDKILDCKLIELFNYSKIYNIDKWLKYDPFIVRGLSYYTGMVFEAFFKNTDIKRAICGGGRYKNINGDKEMECVGFGLGDVVIMEGLDSLKKLPIFEINNIDYVIITLDNLYNVGISIAEKLRSKNKKTILYNEDNKKIKKAFSYADRLNAKYVIFIAPTEYNENCVILKDLLNGSQVKISINDLINL